MILVLLSKHNPKHSTGRDDDTQDQHGFEERAQFSHGLYLPQVKDSAIRHFVKLGGLLEVNLAATRFDTVVQGIIGPYRHPVVRGERDSRTVR